MKLEPLFQLPTAWTAIAQRFAVHVFEGELTLADMARMETLGNEWFAKNPGKLVELAIIHPSNTRMSNAERQRLTRLIKRWERDRIASATVILAEGLVGAMHRSVLTGILMLVPPPHPSKVFGATRDAVGWLAPHVRELCGPAATESAVLGAVERLCTDFLARPNRP